MRVYLRSDSYYMHIGNVVLHDGYIPTVGVDTLVNENFLSKHELMDIEAAVWFKVMVLSSITIDCVSRAIVWSIDEEDDSTMSSIAPPKSGHKYISESMYFGGDSVFLDTDEVYMTVADLLERFSASTCNIQTLNKEIRRLLHVHILPAIKLTHADLHKVEEVREIQQGHIDTLNMRILSIQQVIEKRRASLYIRRQRWISLLKDDGGKTVISKEDGGISMTFVSRLLVHLIKDANQSNRVFESLDNDVQTWKQSKPTEYSSAQCDEYESELATKRAARDAAFRQHQDILEARENLKVISITMEEKIKKTKKKRSKKKNSDWSLHLTSSDIVDVKFLQQDSCDYLDCDSRVKDVEKVINGMMACKIMASSVYEALRTTIKELKDLKESHGVQLARVGSRRPTDVMGKTPPQTIAESVADAMEQESDPMKLTYLEYWDKVQDLCEQLYLDNNANCINCQSKLASNAIQHASTLPPPITTSKRNNILEDISNNLYLHGKSTSNSWHGNNNSDNQCHCVKSVSADWLQDVRICTLEHVDAVVSVVCDRFGNSAFSKSRSKRTCWLAYESYIYGRLIRPLLRFYHCCYNSVVESLKEGVPQLTVEDLELMDGLLVMHNAINCTGTLSIGTTMQTADAMMTSSKAILPLDEKHDSGMIPTNSSTPPKSVHVSPLRRKLSPVRVECLRQSLNKHTNERPVSVLFSKTFTWPKCLDDKQDPLSTRGCISTDSEVKQILTLRRSANAGLLQEICTDDGIGGSLDDFVSDPINVITPSKRQTHLALDSVAEVASYCEEASFSQDAESSLPPAPPVSDGVSIDDIHKCFLSICSQDSLVEKLQAMVRTLKLVSQFWIQVVEQHNGQSCTDPCSDELLDSLVLMLCQWDAGRMAEMYPHVMFLSDHLPTVFDGGQFAYALIQFVIAFDFIKGRILLKKNKLLNSSGTP